MLSVALAVCGCRSLGQTTVTPADRASLSVFVDQSHQFLFAVDAFADSVHRGGYTVVDSRDTFPPDDIDRYSVLVLHQDKAQLDYGEAGLAAIRRHLEKGHGLYVICNPHQSSPREPDVPLQRLLRQFGVRVLRSGTTGPLQIGADPRWGDGFALDSDLAPPHGALEPTGDAAGRAFKAIATDRDGRIVMAALTVGAGRLVVSCEHTLWGRVTDKPQDAQVRGVLLRLMDWLAGAEHVEGPERARRATFTYRPASQRLTGLGHTVYYTQPMKAQAEHLLATYGRVHQALKDFYGCEPDVPITMETLATDGGAFCAFPQIAIGCLADTDAQDGFLLWELTNAWPLPQTASFCEGWTTFTHRLLMAKLGIKRAQTLGQVLASDRGIVERNDPNSDKIDIARAAPDNYLPGRPIGDSSWGHVRMLKVSLLLHDLYEKRGIDLFRRLIAVHRALHGTASLVGSFEEYVREWSLAAGEDMAPYFRRWGARFADVELPAGPDAIRAEAQRLIDTDAQRQAQNARAKAAYQAHRAELADDGWVKAWKVEHNLVGADLAHTWIDDIKSPPASLAYLAAPGGSERRGFLVLHPAAPRQPCIASATLQTPNSDGAALMLGCLLRAGGGAVTVRLHIDGKVACSIQLTSPMEPVDALVDLGPWKGKHLPVCLEVDSQGEWGCREVLVDYIRVVTGVAPDRGQNR